MNKYNLKKTTMLVSLLAASHIGMAASDILWVEAPEMKPLHSLQQQKASAANQWQQQAVQYNFSLIGEEIKAAKNTGFVAESKSFYMDVNGVELVAGISIPVASNTAVIRISSIDEKVQLQGQQVELSQLSTPLSTSVMATGEQLNKLGMPVAENTVAFKVNHQPGSLQLKLNQISPSKDTKFVIHVLEPDSPYSLTMTTAKQLYQAGETLTVKAALLHENGNLPISMQGYISQPNGEKFADLKFKVNKSGQMVADLAQLPFQSMNEGLWEVHTIAKSEVAGQTILRDVSSAFAVSVPTAQFNGQLTLSKAGINLGVNNILSSRYEASGILMGHDDAGNPQPIAMLMTADWLKQGEATLSFKLPQDLINESGLQAPFLVSQLSLKNQSLMAPVQQINSGFQFDIK